MSRLKYILIFLMPFICPVPGLAVNFHDGVRAKQGLYLLSYTSVYVADKTTGNLGKTSIRGYDYRKFEELIRLCYYTPEAVLTVLVPAGKVKSGLYDVSSQGIGDINLGAGYFLPIKEADILPMLFVKFPTGEYDSVKNVNYGTNQYDFKPTVFIYKAQGRFSLDAALKYYFRQENPSTNVSPGDELYLQCLLGWQFSKSFKAGPSLNWMKSGNQERDGTKIADTRRETLSIGTDFYFKLPAFSLTLTYLHDLRTQNTTEGDFFQIKTCYKF